MLSRRARQFVKLLRLLPDPVFRHGLRMGVGAAIENRDVIAPMRLETIVDVGGNVGQFSLLSRALHPNARIYAFEPLPDAAARYRRVFANDWNVTLFEAAISTEAGTATMHVSASADSSSLLPISARQSELFPGTKEVGVTDVEVGPLSGFLSVGDLAGRRSSRSMCRGLSSRCWVARLVSPRSAATMSASGRTARRSRQISCFTEIHNRTPNHRRMTA
jgi:FkbM family methyltransferase